MITTAQLLRVIRRSFDAEGTGSGFFDHRPGSEASPRTTDDLISQLPPELSRVVASILSGESRVLQEDEQMLLVIYLANQWQEILTEDAQLYCTASDRNPYKLNIALAQLLFADAHVRATVAHHTGSMHQSYHTLLMPTALNIRTSLFTPFGALQNLCYLEGHLVTLPEVFETLRIHRRFVNPYDNRFVLPLPLIQRLCRDAAYRDVTATLIFPVLCTVHGIGYETCQALPIPDLKQVLLAGDQEYQAVHADELNHLYQTLLPACQSADGQAALQNGADVLHAFNTLLDSSPHRDKILALRNFASGQTIGDILTVLATEPEACLSENSDNICSILFSAIQALYVFVTHFGSDINAFPDHPSAPPALEVDMMVAMGDAAAAAPIVVGGEDDDPGDLPQDGIDTDVELDDGDEFAVPALPRHHFGRR